MTRQDEANIAFARFLEKHRLRVRPRLTQRQLAQDAGVSTTYLNRVIRYDELLATDSERVKRPSPEVVVQIINALVEYLHEPQLVNEGLRILGYDPTVYGTGEPMNPKDLRLIQMLGELPAEEREVIERMIELAYARLGR